MVWQTWKMAWGAVRANKLRSFLTMLGIIIGVVTLVVLVSIADGAASSVEDEISDIAANYLSVRITDDKENPVTLTEFQELFQDDAIRAAAPVGSTSVTVKTGYTSASMTLTGTTGNYMDIMNLELTEGRFLKNTDLDNHSYVVIITEDTAVELFGHSNAAGETVSLNGKKFRIAGVLAEGASSGIGGMQMYGSLDSDNETQTVSLEGYIPYSTLTRMSDSIREVTQFYVASADETSMERAELAVESILLTRLKNDADAFSIQDQSEVMEAMENVDRTMSLMLGGIAAVSLLVGGIGIMNIMLVSVTERTREIGIRKAIGAGRGSIMVQFLMEALLISLLGCLIGIIVSFGILQAAGHWMGDTMSFQMDMKVAGLAAAFSGVIGIVFGLYPANQAAKKKPIDALRYS